MSTYRTGNHWGVTIVHETSDAAGENDHLVAVVVNGDHGLAERDRPAPQRRRAADAAQAHRLPPVRRRRAARAGRPMRTMHHRHGPGGCTVSFQNLPERPDGCRTVRAAVLAKRLNVAYQLVEGLAIGGHIQGYRSDGKTGAPVLIVPVTEIERLERAIGARK